MLKNTKMSVTGMTVPALLWPFGAMAHETAWLHSHGVLESAAIAAMVVVGGIVAYRRQRR